MIRVSKRKSLTLVELILSLLLLSLVIFTGVSMELGVRRIFSSTDMESQLLQEAAPIMASVVKDISRGIGSLDNFPYANVSAPPPANSTYFIRWDSNANAKVDANDTWVQYQYIPANFQLWRFPNSAAPGCALLTQRATNFSIAFPVNGSSVISLTLRKDPNNPINSTNPQITTQTSAIYGELSLS